MTRGRIGLLIAVAALAAGGLGAGATLAATGGGSGRPPAVAAGGGSPGARGPGYSWYRSMIDRYQGAPMMGAGAGGAPGWMMGARGYRWMAGGPDAPGWMRGGRLPGQMMGGSTDPGEVMGRLWADAPGPRVNARQAARLGGQVPAGASVDRARGAITFTGSEVRFAVVASPPGGPDETFRVAGLVNPAVSVPAGARVVIEVVNADPGTAHGLVVTAARAASSWMPMTAAGPAFPGAALWFLGAPTTAGLHAGAVEFTASAPGHYRYLCPVPGHAQKGMTGPFTVRAR